MWCQTMNLFLIVLYHHITCCTGECRPTYTNTYMICWGYMPISVCAIGSWQIYRCYLGSSVVCVGVPWICAAAAAEVGKRKPWNSTEMQAVKETGIRCKLYINRKLNGRHVYWWVPFQPWSWHLEIGALLVVVRETSKPNNLPVPVYCPNLCSYICSVSR